MKRVVKFHLRKGEMTRIFQSYDEHPKNGNVSIFDMKVFYINIHPKIRKNV